LHIPPGTPCIKMDVKRHEHVFSVHKKKLVIMTTANL